METEATTANDKTSSVLPQLTSSDPPMSIPRRRMSFFTAQVALRISAMVSTLIAIVVTVTNAQTVVVFGFQFEAHYSYSSAFKFLVAANAVVCAFSALSLIFLSRSWSHQLKNQFFLLLHDTVLLVVMISGCSAATAIGYVGRYGEKKMTWQPTCGYVSKFCNRMSVSVAFSYLAFAAYLLLTLLSAHNLMPTPFE